MILSLSATNVRAILLDIEGTTTPIAFVHEVLFPFARARIKDFLVTHRESDAVRRDLELMKAEHARDAAEQLNPPDSIVDYIYWLMDRDRKSTGLKSLQGKIWEQGYADGELKAPVFPDVPPALRRWREAGLRVAIFSSGSVLAQKLLFAHTGSGDLTEFLDDYFDTTTGPKNEAESYHRISAVLQFSPAEVLFISDVVTELDAAGEAGMRGVLCVRPGNKPQPEAGDRLTISAFDEI
jgi:enolase-phosphatase E1